jgi:uncharacterized protein (DUF1501 family)
MTLAALPGAQRLVVIILRGGMDGLDTVRPLGDAGFATLRPGAATDGPALDARFVMHPALSPLLPLWRAGELAFAHAVSTPYRDRRSHFDGQDFLENGGDAPDGTMTRAGDGWLNRALIGLPGAHSDRTAFAVDRVQVPVLRGKAPVSVWSPDADLALSPQAQLLLKRIYAGDELFAQAADQAIALAALTQDEGHPSPRAALRAEALANFAAARLREETRLVAFSLNGWDTHANQHATLPRALAELSTAITTLRAGLGPDWAHTVVMGLTEFGRTARLNGSAGTDHGTGGAAIFAGGALTGGRVVADWPGLGEGALYGNRDLLPTRDLRAHIAWILRDHMQIPRAALDGGTIFPGLEMGTSPGWIA